MNIQLPPHSPESEIAVLGCILIAPEVSLHDISAITQGDAQVFYDLRHQTIYDACVSAYEQAGHLDVWLLKTELDRRSKTESVGGLAFLSTLPDAVASPAALEYHVKILVEKKRLRKLLQLSALINESVEIGKPADGILDDADRELMLLRQKSARIEEQPVAAIVETVMAEFEVAYNNPNTLAGISTGFHDLDSVTGGLKPGEMWVLAARPSMGKTSLAMNIAQNVAEKLPVGIFSLEMSRESLTKRMICSAARINMEDIYHKQLSEQDFYRLGKHAAATKRSQMYINDASGLQITQLRARARRMAQVYGVKLLVIDYLQLVNSLVRKESRNAEVTDISNGLKQIAKDLNIPVLVLSQLNRDVEKEKERKPRMSDIRDSGAIEQDADLIALLYRDFPQGEAEDSDTISVKMRIAKQRNGKTGEVAFVFLKKYTRYELASKI